MDDDILNLVEKKGWRTEATLQHFKLFSFREKINTQKFLLELINVSTPKEIHLQATPNQFDFSVQVLVACESSKQEEVYNVLYQIEKIYQDIYEL